MAWHEPTLQLEIAVEFQRLAPQTWDRTVAWIFNRRLWMLDAGRTHAKEWAARAQRQPAGERLCVACGATFAMTKYRERRGHDRVCSVACRIRAALPPAPLHTINGESMPLTAWATRYGIRLGTVWKRIKDHGWSVERAVTTPVKRSGEATA